ncbi:DUF3237 domain-containing protein, partial [Verrucomicrobia bacterium]|nr:DUF3237 domain-containing protein [Verrucomicrobiota bacterium]
RETGIKGSGAEKREPTDLSTEYVMTLHAPLDPGQAIDASLIIYNVREGGWVKGPRIEGKLKAPAADWLRILPETAPCDWMCAAPSKPLTVRLSTSTTAG